ncbi:hypothetical protein EZI54_11860 [Marinobacter halodurans]|uniref:DUF2238 domain-containing protein n=1 Tax=Marinobacter halodurans TaxID=2528979 RepID=A0ABY1ZNA1_9GAMM|nr:hypothetical protein [Marinobacter halodurans]TBW55147.1 hypothetical protein EZI54_11860 [Marinobacter halodurans]
MRFRITHRRITFALQLVLATEAAFALWEMHWLTAGFTLLIIGITFFPALLERRFRIFVPPQLQLLAILFVFASLFLGEVRDYYTRYWWWDVLLHTSSGFLLGIVGFLLVHILNEIERIDMHLKPGFVAFFAFMFAVGCGALWEIFEFTMDQVFGTNMQKAMLGDPSGLTDTMWDLIVDTIGALVIAGLGYRFLKHGRRESFLERWINSFIERNPQLFGN